MNVVVIRAGGSLDNQNAVGYKCDNKAIHNVQKLISKTRIVGINDQQTVILKLIILYLFLPFHVIKSIAPEHNEGGIFISKFTTALNIAS